LSPPISFCRQVRGESRRTYGTPSFHFPEQGLKPLPIFIQSLRDEAAPHNQTCAKLNKKGGREAALFVVCPDWGPYGSTCSATAVGQTGGTVFST